MVPAFIGQALSGTPLTIFGDGSQTRSFCYVSDLIDGIFRLAMSDFHEPVNIGNPREMTIKQFAEEIIRITGTKSQIEYKPLPVDDPKVRQPDITRARKVLGWEPKVEFDEGITKTIEYFKGCLERGGSSASGLRDAGIGGRSSATPSSSISLPRRRGLRPSRELQIPSTKGAALCALPLLSCVRRQLRSPAPVSSRESIDRQRSKATSPIALSAFSRRHFKHIQQISEDS